MDFALWNRGAVTILIETRAKAKGAVIHWGDETAVINTDVRGSLLCAAQLNTGGLCGWQNTAKIVDDFYRHHSGKSVLDDH